MLKNPRAFSHHYRSPQVLVAAAAPPTSTTAAALESEQKPQLVDVVQTRLDPKVEEVLSMAEEYLSLAELHPPPSSLFLSKHLRWLFRAELQHAWKVFMLRHAEQKRSSSSSSSSRSSSSSNNPKSEEDKEEGTATGNDSDGDAAVTAAEEWRMTAWNFLVRPYLTEHWQFEAVVRRIRFHLMCEATLVLATTAVVAVDEAVEAEALLRDGRGPLLSFKQIKVGDRPQMVGSKQDGGDVAAVETGLSLFSGVTDDY